MSSVPLVDPFGRRVEDLRLSVTDRCNFRCTYCMPAEGLDWLPRSDLLTYEELTRIARICVDRWGFSGIRITAVVIHACGEMRAGDLLMPFIPEPMPRADPPGVPVYRDPARILFGEADQMMGAPGRLMVIDRGEAHGVRPGQRVTLFRRGFGSREVIGDAVVQTVREDSARIRVERASGAIWFSDSAALQVSSRR